MVRAGVLPPAESAEYIAKNASYVKIHDDGLEKLCDQMMSSIESKLEPPSTGVSGISPDKEHPKAVDWVFVVDSLNFCFWSYSGQEKWTVNGHSGYYALEAALSRAIKEGQDIVNPEFYSKVTKKQMKHILRGDNDVEIPLFDNRVSVLHEVGTILLEQYDGTFETCLKQADKSAVKLLQIIVENFPCFQDEATYKSKKVALYKRAQILVADMWNFFDGKGWGEFNDIDQITMFADYRVPQVLVYFNAMSYTEGLMDKLKKDELLECGSEEEVEIRGCSIHAVELLKKRIEDRIKKNKQEAEVPNSSLIDYYLWCYRRKYAEELEKIPFHKTLGIFY